MNEELGFVDHIFSDKTGTLTSNNMQLTHIAMCSKNKNLNIIELCFGPTKITLEIDKSKNLSQR